MNQLLIISLKWRWEGPIPNSQRLPPGVLDSFSCQIKRGKRINKHEKLRLSRYMKEKGKETRK